MVVAKFAKIFDFIIGKSKYNQYITIQIVFNNIYHNFQNLVD